MHSTDSNLTSRGYGRRQYGQGRYGVPVQIGGFGKATDKATLKRLRLQQQRQREGAAASQLAQLAPAGFSAQAQELGAIGKVGDVKQQQAQLALDEAY